MTPPIARFELTELGKQQLAVKSIGPAKDVRSQGGVVFGPSPTHPGCMRVKFDNRKMTYTISKDYLAVTYFPDIVHPFPNDSAGLTEDQIAHLRELAEQRRAKWRDHANAQPPPTLLE